MWWYAPRLTRKYLARVEVANTLAYYTAFIITARKSFVVPTPELTEFLKNSKNFQKFQNDFFFAEMSCWIQD